MLYKLVNESEVMGLRINMEKTKTMTNSKKIPIEVNQGIVEYVDEYIYLGQTISMNNQMEKRSTGEQPMLGKGTGH